MINYLNVSSKKIESISEINFLSEKNEELKKMLISLILEEKEKEIIEKVAIPEQKELIADILENASIKIIIKHQVLGRFGSTAPSKKAST